MAGSKLKLIFSNASNGQKIVITTIVVAVVILVLIILNWANKEELSLLYSNLKSEDAGAIVTKLDDLGVKYELKDGNAILVPKDEIYKLRIQLAEEGLPSSKGFGYELLDKSSFGLTDFLQKANFHRALEGEISRTICNLDPIENARVHLVIPDPAIFKEDEKPVTAAVTLKLRGNNILTNEQIQSIVFLVSSSTEGLLPKNVTVVDSKGNILSSEQFDANMNATASSFNKKMEIEKYLTDRISTMLSDVLGPKNAVVRVSADLDMEGYEKSDEKYDPESAVVRSESISESSSSIPQNQNENKEATGAPSESSESEITTNYEINKSIERVIKSPGSIKRLTVSVLVNGKYNKEENEDGETVINYIQRTPEEIVEITSIVKNAVGFNSIRGDKVTVSNLQFETLEEIPIDDSVKISSFAFSGDVIEKIFVIFLLLLGIFLIKSILKKYDLSQLTALLVPTTTPSQVKLPGVYREKGIPEPQIERSITGNIPADQRRVSIPTTEAGMKSLTAEENAVLELEKSAKAMELEARKNKALQKQEELKAQFALTESLDKSKDLETQKKHQMKKQVSDYINEKPTVAASILRSWLNN